jgi:hypothetical protein
VRLAKGWCWLFPLLMLSMIFAAKVQAEPDNNNQEAKLAITPQLCILKSEEDTCSLDVSLSWSNTNGAVCILSDYEGLQRWCSETEDVHSLTFRLTTSEDIHFVMVDKDTWQTLAGVYFRTTPVSDTNVRRRYRNPWSLF